MRGMRWGGERVFGFEGEEAGALRQVEVDVTRLEAEEAAGVIYGHVLEVCPGLNAQ